MTIALRGMAWDHPRARDPLEAISADWMRGRDVSVEWDARPLKDFEDQPLEELATIYDLILIDHPFVATAADSGLIAPVDDWVDARYLADQAEHSVGPSYASYSWDGKAVGSRDRCGVPGERGARGSVECRATDHCPETWAQVFDLAGRCSAPTSRVACAAQSEPRLLRVSIGRRQHRWPRILAAGDADSIARRHARRFEFLRALAARPAPAFTRAPIRSPCPTAWPVPMKSLYVPLMFGYSNYARRGFRPRRLSFGDAPRGRGGGIGSVLGRSRPCAVSPLREPRRCSRTCEPHRFSRRAVRDLCQYGRATGPCQRLGVSERQRADRRFLHCHSRSIEQAFVRPRVTGHRRFQPAGGRV